MNQDLHYTGYSANPSDYECQDGELAMSLNLINEDGGSVKALGEVGGAMSIPKDYKIIFIHKVVGQTNYIAMKDGAQSQFGLYWCVKLENSDNSITFAEIKGFSQSGFKTIVAVGNTLAVSVAEGVYYLLWKGGGYKPLGFKPPFTPISFGAYKVGILEETNSTTYENCPRGIYEQYSNVGNGASNTHPPTTEDGDSFWTNVSNQAYGLLLREVADKVNSKGYIYQPCYIRYAYKLYDGNYYWHSTPILMLVCTIRPEIFMSFSSGGEYALKVSLKLNVPYFGISYRVFGDLTALKDWSDIITGIDVFMSSPLYTYQQDKGLGRPTSRYQFYDGLYSSDSSGDRGRYTTRGDSDTTSAFVGHFATSIDGEYKDHYVDSPWTQYLNLVCNIAKKEDFEDRLQHEQLYYKISSFSLDELKNTTGMEKLPLIKTDLTQLNTLERLEDDFNSHATLKAGAMYNYNSRLLLGHIELIPPAPFPLCCSINHSSATTDIGNASSKEIIKVFTRVNGIKCVSTFQQPKSSSDKMPIFYPFANSFPRYIYHPDPSAYKMEIYSADGKFFSFKLKQHPYLNGAYWFGGLASDVPVETEGKEDVTDTSAMVGNKVYISEINNPFIFPAMQVVTLACNNIYQLTTAAKALSQGQFGQFPLYAFTDEGVWAMEISQTGTISARQPITRDVCINPEGITQIDSAVLFPTNRGIMLISGSQTECISDVLNTATPFDVRTLPGMDKLHAMLGDGHELDNCIPTVPFLTFLKDCRMIYDYVHQRIIVYNENYTYAYVYSLKSKLWGMMYSDIKSNLNSYPNALAVTKVGKLVDFSLDTDKTQPGLLLTRPLKLGGADVMKTIDTVIQRGNFQRGHVQTVLYGSRNLKDWHLVWSSKDHYLRGFRGTPYKYFRIALLCNLDPGESIFGASVSFNPRLGNQLR